MAAVTSAAVASAVVAPAVVASAAAVGPAIRTIYRLYPDPASDTHYTAVLLKTGKFLEVKNPNRKPDEAKPAPFASLDEWRAARGCDSAAVIRESAPTRTTPVTPPLVVDPAHGFNVPTTDAGAGKWFQWCYGIIAEVAPELFDSKRVTTAFNDLAAACVKYPELKTYRGLKKYDHSNMLWYTYDPPYSNYSWNGFPVEFPYIGLQQNPPEIAAKVEIISKYKVLYDLLKPKIGAFLEKKSRILMLEKCIAGSQKFLDRAEEKRKAELRRHNATVQYEEKMIKQYAEEYKMLTGKVIEVRMATKKPVVAPAGNISNAVAATAAASIASASAASASAASASTASASAASASAASASTASAVGCAAPTTA